MIVEIDLTKMIPPEMMAYPSILRDVIPDIAEAARTEIIRLAGQKLGVTSDDYTQGVQPIEYHWPSGAPPSEGAFTVATIGLVGWLPNAIEKGWSGGDMKPALLGGRTARETKSGELYAVVPFRHGAPGGSRRNFQKMGHAHARRPHSRGAGTMSTEAATRLGERVYGAAKKLRGRKRLGADHSPKLRPHHATDIHHGMVRQRRQYAKATQSKYMTFRTVKASSPGWVHPGIEPRGIFTEASAYVGEVANHLLKHALNGAHR